MDGGLRGGLLAGAQGVAPEGIILEPTLAVRLRFARDTDDFSRIILDILPGFLFFCSSFVLLCARLL